MSKELITKLIEALKITSRNWMWIQMSDSEFWPYNSVIHCRYCKSKYTVPARGLTQLETALAFGPFLEHTDNCPMTILEKAIENEQAS